MSHLLMDCSNQVIVGLHHSFKNKGGLKRYQFFMNVYYSSQCRKDLSMQDKGRTENFILGNRE